MFELFGLALFTSVFSATILSMIGRHFVLRGLSLYVLPLHQLAILVYLIFSFWFPEGVLLKVFGAAVSTLILSMILKLKRAMSQHSLLIAYVIILATNLLLVRLHPAFEIKVSQALFGDIALLSESSSLFLIAGAFCCLCLMWIFRRELLRQSFEKHIYGRSLSVSSCLSAIDFIFFFFVTFCLIDMGFLFSIASLILGPLILGGAFLSWRSMSIASSLSTALGVAFGFGLSLKSEVVGATPAAVVAVATLCLIVVGLKKTLSR